MVVSVWNSIWHWNLYVNKQDIKNIGSCKMYITGEVRIVVGFHSEWPLVVLLVLCWYWLGVYWSLPLLPPWCKFDGALITRSCFTISSVLCMTNQCGSVAVVSNTDDREKQVCRHNVSHGTWVYCVRVKVCILCGASVRHWCRNFYISEFLRHLSLL